MDTIANYSCTRTHVFQAGLLYYLAWLIATAVLPHYTHHIRQRLKMDVNCPLLY